jgi:hypothetical protein
VHSNKSRASLLVFTLSVDYILRSEGIIPAARRARPFCAVMSEIRFVMFGFWLLVTLIL